MKVVKREGINAPYGKCTDCGVRTRSHVLEYPDYEEYEEEIPEELQEYQGRKKFETDEDPQVIIKYQRLNEPTVICHKCWVKNRDKAVAYLNQHLANRMEDLPTHITKARKFLKDWQYFDFSGLRNTVIPKPTEDDLAVQELTKKVKTFLIGSEEE